MTLEELNKQYNNINTKLNNVLIDLKTNHQLIYDLLKNLGVDINEYRNTYTENYNDDSPKELSDYRL